MAINCADKTIFTLRDQGDSTVGLAPAEMTLTYDWHIDKSGFEEILSLLYSLNDIGWHGPVSGWVEYSELTSCGWVTEVQLDEVRVTGN